VASPEKPDGLIKCRAAFLRPSGFFLLKSPATGIYNIFQKYRMRILHLAYHYRRHIEVHGRPTPAVFRKKPHQASKKSYLLVWTVDSYTPIQEYRLLYRQIKPFHPVRRLSVIKLWEL
jgi:hypothetical protein